jgi:hypothetical protein
LLDKVTEEENELNLATWIGIIEETADILEIYDTLIELYKDDDTLNEREWIIHKRESLITTSLDLWIDLVELLRIQWEKRELKWWFRNGVIWIF